MSLSRNLCTILEQMGEEDKKENLNNILESIMNNYLGEDIELILVLLEQIKGVLDFICRRSMDKQEHSRVIISSVLPWLKRLLKSEEAILKQKSGDCLQEVCERLSEEERGEHILTIMLELGHDDINVDNRVIAVNLLTSLCLMLERQVVEGFLA